MGEPTYDIPFVEKPPERRLDSWKDIASYLNRDVTTVQRWEKREAMPVHRHVHDKRGSVYALTDELDEWVQSRRSRVDEPENEPQEEMPPALPSDDGATFGNFTVDLQTEELRKDGLPVRLPAQSFQVLRMLLSRPGELVSRPVLQKALWPDEEFGDFEHGLNAAVNRLREALGDSAEVPQYVETLPQRGYRFIAEVDIPVDPMSLEPALAAVQKPSLPGRSIPGIWIVLLLALCAAGALFLYLREKQPLPSTASDLDKDLVQSHLAVSVTPLTALPGMAYAPTFSPDGSQVAFTWDGGKTEQTSPYDLYAKVIGSEQLQQLTHKPALWIVPAWSPDGRSIAFARDGAGISGIFMISAIGGPERKLADAQVTYELPISISWSPDGRTLLYATKDGMHSVDPDSDEVRSVRAPSGCDAPMTPAFSPDGNWIAFSCYLDLNYDLYVVPAHGGPAKKVTRVDDLPRPLAWSRDSERIIYAQHKQLFEVSKSSGGPHFLAFAHDALGSAVARSGERLAYVQWTRNVNLWRMNLSPSGGGSPSLMALTSREQETPDISPDGKRIAFESLRSGRSEVWVSNLDGGDAIQLSNFHSETGAPRWSPDGKWIVFDSRESGRASLYLVDPQVGVPRRLDTGNFAAQVPSWSRDGKWIYFHGLALERGGIYKIALQGGALQSVSSSPGINAQQAKAGNTLYFMNGVSDAQIYVRNLDNGTEVPVQGMPKVHTPVDWVLASNGIYFVDTAKRPATIDLFDFALGRVTRQMPLPKVPSYWGGLSLSPNESWLAYAQVDRNASDIMLVEHFR